MKKFVLWLLGTVTVKVTGAETEAFLNRCTRETLLLRNVTPVSEFAVEVTAAGWEYRGLRQLAEQMQCEIAGVSRQGLPFFLLRFRRRYALLAGAVLFLILTIVGSHTILTVDVTGNETIPDEVIISQLRLCGVSVGTWGPSVPIRAVENRMMRAMNELSVFSLNLYGSRAEVIVREGDPVPEVRQEEVPTDVVSAASGVITHIEAWQGDALFQEGDTVCKGDILIAGRAFMDLEPMVPGGDGGFMLVHGEGRVLARTRRTMQAQMDLSAPVKTYTGEEKTRYSLSVMGHWMKFYENSGIPYENYDIISQLKSWTPVPGKQLPLVWQKETCRAYTLALAPLDEVQAEERLKQSLLDSLREAMDEGEILTTEYYTARKGDTLTVILQAECSEQIGRLREMDTTERVEGPRHPSAGNYQEELNTKEQSP